MSRASLPNRTASGMSSDGGDDPSGAASILFSRLHAWKHVVAHLESYMTATEKMHKTHAKEYERVLKTISEPLKEGHQFDQSLAGVGGLFENIKLNTQGIAHTHSETEKNLRVSVLPMLHRLQDEIKAKDKDLASGAAKGVRAVDKARVHTQDYIDLLAQHAESTARRSEPAHDPYVIQRGLYHRLNKQIVEENSSRQDILAVQDSFQQFEAHVLQTVQQALATFMQFVGGQADRTKGLYADMVATGQHIPLDFEWKGFVQRNSQLLMDRNAPPRSIETVSFPRQDHASTRPLMQGTLERKSRLMVRSYSAGYFVATPSKFLHEFKDADNFRREPTPELSLYLPDCSLAGPDGTRFTIKGKDASRGKVGIKMGTTHELAFKASSPEDAERWCLALRTMTSTTSSSASAPVSPIETRSSSASTTQAPALPERLQTAGLETGQVTGKEPVTSPTTTADSPAHAGGAGSQTSTVVPAPASATAEKPGAAMGTVEKAPLETGTVEGARPGAAHVAGDRAAEGGDGQGAVK
ncbi:MAG: hypothetical protein M1832_006141 [Thelocarpon impressellum]|nr:MAG: hypothetical protein M1832_006141 [Thelocarpon impressellum]